jgi:hypothetical protein
MTEQKGCTRALDKKNKIGTNLRQHHFSSERAMADITYYVALPFLHDDSGSLAAGAAEECQSASGAIRRAEVLSRAPGSIGALAFSRTGDPMMGEFSDAQVIRAFGEVPTDLSAL